MTTAVLDGWNIGEAAAADQVAWGERGDARAKVLASGDGYVLAVVEADAGYRGTPHEHTSTEFLFVLAGRVRNQGRMMSAGDAYVAAVGSTHSDFEAEIASTYLSIFRV